MKYRAEIDGLRSIAVMPVILFHAGFDTFRGGFVGVDIFFVISGYLITTILLTDLEQGRFSIVRFYERRARRILPALFTVILACIPFAWAWMLPEQAIDFAQSLVAVVLFVSNFLFWKESGYFAPAAELKPLLHTWSLAVEEQYYLLFPPVLFLLWRLGRRFAFGAVVGLSLASIGVMLWALSAAPGANFYLAPPRAWELFAGSICAFVLGQRGAMQNGALAAVGLGLILYAIFFFDGAMPFPSLAALAPVGGTALIILFAGPETRVARLLQTRGLVGIGLISYSAYLWHQPLFAFARVRLVSEPPAGLMLALAGLSLGLAYLTWKYVEQPFRRPPVPLLPSRKAVFGAALAGGTVCAALGAVGILAGGFPDRFPLDDRQQALLATAAPSPKRNECHMGEESPRTASEACSYFASPASVAVIGDSHTVELAYALARALEPAGIGIRQFSFAGCWPSLDPAEGPSPCANWTSAALAAIEADPAITDVVVSYRILRHLETDTARREGSLRQILERLAETRRVIYVMQSPELPGDIRDLIYRGHFDGEGDIRGNSTAHWQAMRQPFDQWWQDSGLAGKVRFFDPQDRFCDAEWCRGSMGETAFYFDDDHVSVSGAGLFAGDLARLLTAPAGGSE